MMEYIFTNLIDKLVEQTVAVRDLTRRVWQLGEASRAARDGIMPLVRLAFNEGFESARSDGIELSDDAWLQCSVREKAARMAASLNPDPTPGDEG